MSSVHNRCDVHVITIGRSDQWFDQCLKSLEGEPVNIHIIEGTQGHIGVGRFKGFSTGNAEFVSFVDDDDFIDPGAFEHCFKILDKTPNIIGVSTRERILKENFTTEQEIYNPNDVDEYRSEACNDISSIHHLVVMRRKMLEPFLHLCPSWNVWCEWALYSTLYKNGHKFAFSNEIYYNLRDHSNRTCTSTRVRPNQAVLEEMKYIGHNVQNLSPGTKNRRVK